MAFPAHFRILGQRIQFLSPLSEAHAHAALRAALGEGDRNDFEPVDDGLEGVPFKGTIDGRSFRIRGVVPPRRYHPLIEGTLCPTAHGTRVELTMRMSVFELVFMVQMLSSGVVVIWFTPPQPGRSNHSGIALGMFLMHFLLVLYQFKRGTALAEQNLRRIFEVARPSARRGAAPRAR